MRFDTLGETEQREVAERLLRLTESGWKPFWCPDSTCDGSPHWLVDENGCNTWLDLPKDAVSGPAGELLGPVYVEPNSGDVWGRPVLDPVWSHNHARVDQRLPAWNRPWTRLMLSGRGAGKTATGTEFVTLCARKGLDGAIVGRRGTELENTHVATLIARAHPEFMPEYLASKDLVVWPNGAKTFLFSAERPENIRSVNLSYGWVDEASHMDEIEKAWTNLKFAARVKKPGNPIHLLITSTPTPTPWTMEMEDDPDVEVIRVSTYANRANLDEDFLLDLEKKYEGTRIGRQELHGEVLRDVEGALWNEDLFHHERADAVQFARWVDSMDDIVVAVDPAGSKGPRSDATGIIAAGAHHNDEDGNRLAASRFYVLADGTIKGTPTEWAERTYRVARLTRANRIVAEKNFGGEMVRQTLKDYAKLHPEIARDENGEEYKIELLQAVKSKETRAEPTVGKYEQSRVSHVTSPTAYGDLSMLEKEMCGWVPKSRGGKFPSPNRIDALVWAVRELDKAVKYSTTLGSARTLNKMLKTR